VIDDQEWEVQEVLAVQKTHKTLHYRVQWVGHDEDPVWYPAADFKYAPHKLRDFHYKYPALPGPPRLLDKWIKGWEDGLDSYEDLDDSREMTASLRASFFQRRG
jgi:hypothetical protein